VTIPCTPCGGRGFRAPVDGKWPDPCPVCRGRGRLTVGRLAKLLEIRWKQAENLALGRARRKTVLRTRAKLFELGLRVGSEP
jgi:hypothetical protein